jgi:hypothetical protein
LCSGLTQPPRKRKVCITEFLTQSSNKGRWSATTRRSPGGEAFVGLGKATSMRECGATQRFWVSRKRGAKVFERERQKHAKIFEWAEGFYKFLKKFKSLRINNGFYQKNRCCLWRIGNGFLVKTVVEEVNNNGFYKITIVDSPWKIK